MTPNSEVSYATGVARMRTICRLAQTRAKYQGKHDEWGTILAAIPQDYAAILASKVESMTQWRADQ